MDENVDAGRHRTASALALAGAAALAAVTLWCAGQAWPLNRDNPAATTTNAFLFLAAVASARLTVSCLIATHQLLAELKHLAPTQPFESTSPPELQRPAPRRRAASLFLALAALTGPAATAAGATPLSCTSTTARAASGGFDAERLAVPGFEEAPDPCEAASPAFSGEAAAPSAHGEADSAHEFDESVKADGTDESAPPAPGWTPPSAAATSDHCRLFLGGGANQATKTSHVVVRGESLWSVAATYLPQHSSAAEVAAALPIWFEANPGLITHADLLHAGDALAVPAHFTTGVTP